MNVSLNTLKFNVHKTKPAVLSRRACSPLRRAISNLSKGAVEVTLPPNGPERRRALTLVHVTCSSLNRSANAPRDTRLVARTDGNSMYIMREKVSL